LHSSHYHEAGKERKPMMGKNEMEKMFSLIHPLRPLKGNINITNAIGTNMHISTELGQDRKRRKRRKGMPLRIAKLEEV
jgi:hypothetical protein